MALTRLTYLEGLRAILLRAYQAEGWAFIAPLLPYAIDWVKDGATAPIRLDRRDTVRAMLTALWQTDHAQHNAHVLSHVLRDAGVRDADVEDVPATEEPVV